MARIGGAGGFAVAARLGDVEIGTGTQPAAPERRQVRINGAPASVNSLSEWLSVLWLTPAMDRLFSRLGRRSPPLPRPAGARARAGPCAPRFALRSGDARAQQAAGGRSAGRPIVARGAGRADGGAWHGDRGRAVAHRRRTRPSASRTPPKTNSRARRSSSKAGIRPILARSFATTAAATRLPAAQPSVRTDRTCSSPIAPSRWPPRALRPASRRRCCSASSSPMRNWSPNVAASRRSCCSTRWPRISIPKRRAALFARLEGRGQVWMTATEAELFDGVGQATPVPRRGRFVSRAD